jgi:hypothetical protein
MQKTLSVLLCVFAISCAQTDEGLGGGYRYVQLDGRNGAIVDRNSLMVVDPNVRRHKIVGSFVVGERIDADIDDKLSKSFGYFIFDMRNGQLLEGLRKGDFQGALRTRNLPVDSFD